MFIIITTAILVSLVDGVFASEETFSYDAQDEWGGICVEGNNFPLTS